MSCQHRRTEPVVLTTGEVVAAVCVACLTRLPASWGCPDCEVIQAWSLASAAPTAVPGRPCPAHYGQGA